MSTKKPIFLVSGATGAQGGSVVKSLLKEGKWHIRAITRNVNCENAKCLKDQGVEMITCDITKPDELKRAMTGVDVYFAMTNYFDPSQKTKEEEVGKMQVDCAKACGVKHFIWSDLPDAERISNGKYKLHHFTNKARVGEYAMKNVPTTLVYLSFYYQNFETFFKPQKSSDGTLVYSLPMTKSIAAFDINDLGPIICCIANNREKFIGKRISLVGDTLPLEDYIRTIQEVTGNKTRLNVLPHDEFAKTAGPELADMFGYFNEFGFFGNTPNIESAKTLCPLKNFRTYLQTTVNPK